MFFYLTGADLNRPTLSWLTHLREALSFPVNKPLSYLTINPSSQLYYSQVSMMEVSWLICMNDEISTCHKHCMRQSQKTYVLPSPPPPLILSFSIFNSPTVQHWLALLLLMDLTARSHSKFWSSCLGSHLLCISFVPWAAPLVSIQSLDHVFCGIEWRIVN